MSEIVCRNNEILNIYRKWYAEIYEINETDTDDVNLLLSLIGSEPKNVLEIACGGGRVLIPLAKAGHYATGLDMDETRLAHLQRKSKDLNNLQHHYRDAVKGDWGSDYDVVVLAGNLLLNIVADIPYDKAQQFFIDKAASSLKIGGYIFLEFSMFPHPEKVLAKDDGRVIFEGKDNLGVYGKHVVIGDSYDIETHMAYGRRYTELDMPSGEQEIIHEKWKKHIPTLEQVHKWLDEAGFVVECEFGDCDKNPISEKTGHAIIWARKAKNI